MAPIIILPLALLQGAPPLTETPAPSAPPAPPVFYEAAPAPPPPPSPPRSALARPASPAGNPGPWVTSNDYPAPALRQELQGVVRFTVIINPAGRVSDCWITGSSGTPLLDETSCRLITRRGRFNPARDANGEPVEGRWSSSVRWQIPDFEPALLAMSTTRRFTVAIDGTISGCMLETVAAGAFPYPVRCDQSRFSEPYRDSNGNSLRRGVNIVTTTRLSEMAGKLEPSAPGAEPAYPAATPTKAPLPGVITRTFVVDANGSASDCRIVAVTGDAARQYSVGPMACRVRFYDRYDEPAGSRKTMLVTEVEHITVGEAPTLP